MEHYTPEQDHLDDLIVTVVAKDPEKSINLGKYPRCLWDTVTVKDHNPSESLALSFLSPVFSKDPRKEAELKIDTHEFGGAFRGQLDYPKRMDITGLDVFLPKGISDELVNELMVALRIGECTHYHTPIGMMGETYFSLYRRFSDEFPIFVHLPTIQNIRVVISCDRSDIDWNGARFGVRLRGVGYREVI